MSRRDAARASSDATKPKHRKEKHVEEEEDEIDDKLVINEKFAQDFERRERFKDLQRNKEKLASGLLESDEDDSEDESEDEAAELLNPALDLQIVQTINMLRKKDPRIYDKSTRWFTEQDAPTDEEEAQGGEVSKKKRFKDVLREQLLRGEDGGDDDEQRFGDDEHKSRFVYDKEQEDLRRAFLSAAEDESDGDEDGLLQKKSKTPAQMETEERELQEALREMESLQPGKDEGEAFLQDFLKNKRWQDTTAPQRFRGAQSESESESEEEELDKADLFESKYNFRFEELADRDAAYIVQGHARNVAGSLRREDDKRKKEREARKERKEKEKRQKEEELKRLKNLKKRELEERLAKIAALSGSHAMGALSQSLDEDWDPSAHDALMAQQYDDEYYAQQDDDFAPAEEIDAELDPALGEDEELAYGEGEGEEEDAYGEDEEGEQAASSAEAQRAFQSAQDELYALDYEDLVAGIPCRFKYRQVEPEDFGLSAEEILLAEDQELNRFVSLKHLAPYRQKKWTKSARDMEKKRKRLRASLAERVAAAEEQRQGKSKVQGGAEVAAAPADQTQGGEGETQKRKRRRRPRDEAAEQNTAAAEEGEQKSLAEPEPAQPVEVVAEQKIEKKSKKKPFRDHVKNKKKDKPQDATGKRLSLYN